MSAWVKKHFFRNTLVMAMLIVLAVYGLAWAACTVTMSLESDTTHVDQGHTYTVKAVVTGDTAACTEFEFDSTGNSVALSADDMTKIKDSVLKQVTILGSGNTSSVASVTFDDENGVDILSSGSIATGSTFTFVGGNDQVGQNPIVQDVGTTIPAFGTAGTMTIRFKLDKRP